MKYNSLHTKGVARHYSVAGFTLVETLIAITVLILVVIGPVTIAQQGIKNARYASEQITATFLAQEAIEGVRSFRDKKALEVLNGASGATNDWYSAINGDCKTTAGCAYENRRNDDGGGRSGDFNGCARGGDDGLCTLNVADDGQYTHRNGGEPSIYRRKVFINEVSPGVVQIKTEVAWNAQNFGGGEKKVILQSYLYDHYQRFNP